MDAYFNGDGWELFVGDCRVSMMFIPDSSVDSAVCDPPYELGFMGKSWDSTGIANDSTMWAEVLRILKPGGHVLAFSGSRTYHRMVCAIEDAGFEIRDQIMWIYGSGFPKSLDVSKAIDKAAGDASNDTPASGVHETNAAGEGGYNVTKNKLTRSGESTDGARQWEGWGTALKPAHEPIVMARKPLSGTVADNVLTHSTGAINIDGCRVEGDGGKKWETLRGGIWRTDAATAAQLVDNPQGRWPANLIHDGSDEVLAAFPNAKGQQGDLTNHANMRQSPNGCYGAMAPAADHIARIDSSTSAARFFYCAKASKSDRNVGCDELTHHDAANCTDRTAASAGGIQTRAGAGRTSGAQNNHPTVKPNELMRYLCRLVTPPGGTVFDPFTGSGSTGRAALQEGFRFIGCELSAEYAEIAKARMPCV